MNLRQVDKTIFIAKHSIKNVIEKKELAPEDLVFDEAIKSEIIEEKKDYIKKLEKKEKELAKKKKDFKDEEKIKKLDKSIENIDKLKNNLENSIKKEKE